MNFKSLAMNKNKIGLLLAAAAAYGVYRYSRLTTEQKNNLVAKGKDLLTKSWGSLTETMSKAKTPATESGY
jgi:hypothetical protein